MTSTSARVTRRSRSPKRVSSTALDVERWRLKVLAGLTYGKLVKSNTLRLDAAWLKILFGDRWPPLGAAFGARRDADPRVRRRGDHHDDHGAAIWGGRFSIDGLTFLLALGRLEEGA